MQTSESIPAPRPAAAVAENDRRFASLRREYAEPLFRFCLRLTDGCRADAEDVAQETLLAAYEGLPRFAGRATLRTYLYRIAVYRWRRLKQARRLESGTAGGGGDPDAFAPDPAGAADQRLDLAAALARLPDPLREAFLLVKGEGMTYREAARVLETPQGTVQSRVFDAVRRLRALLADDEAEVRRRGEAREP